MKQPNSAQKAHNNWSTLPRAVLLALAASIALAGCGGGASAESSSINSSNGSGAAESAEDSTTVAPAKVSLPQALFELSYPQVVNTSYLSATVASANKASAAASSPAPTITPTELLNWAEVMFPTRFPGGAQNQTNGTLTYRYYAGTDVYLGVANNVVYAFGSDTASKIINAGNLGDFNCTVKPASCMIPTPVQAFACDANAITCVEVASSSTQDQESVPLTFGQPFKLGDWKHKETGLIARDNFGQPVAIQTDEISSHRDGSARFAVISANVSNLKAGERRIINFHKGTNTAVTPALPSDPSWNLELRADVFNKQVTLVKFGNRNGHTAGIPFVVGESVTLKLIGKTTEQFNLVINDATAGGDFTTLTALAKAFRNLINQNSTHYSAYKMGEGDGYENLWITTKAGNGGAFTIQFEYAGSARLTQTGLTSYQEPQVLIAKGQEELRSKILQGTGSRLSGAIAQEFTISAPFKNSVTGAVHPQLNARFHARLYEAGKRIKTDVAIENNWAYNPNPGNITYQMTFTQNGQVVHTQPAFTHYHHSRWKKTLWTGTGAPLAVVRHHMGYFMSTGITWNYDRSIKVSEATLTSLASRLNAANTAPMGNAFISHYFPTSGGRDEIGPLPKWTALYLITQDDRARAAMMANADAAASVPVHYRDAATDQPIDLDRHPGVALLFGTSSATDALPSMVDSTTPWTVDSAHQGSFVFIPYVITGDAYYLDEVMFWAAWNMGAVNPGYRKFSAGLINSDQVRGQAWSLRSISDAARIVPDQHALKAYFSARLENNLIWYVNNYPLNPDPSKVSPLGAIEKPDSPTSTAAWQNDFFNIVLTLLAEDGYPAAQTYNAWLSRFTVGRFLNDSNGYCLAKAPAQYVRLTDNTGKYTDNWATVFKQTWPDLQCTETTPIDAEAYADSAFGYAANARAMLAATANTGIPNAYQAYYVWRSMTPLIDNAMKSDPTWAIIPR